MPGRNRHSHRRSQLSYIRERDKNTCQLCFEFVDPTLPPTDGWGGTLDHIIPKSQGGKKWYENLRLAHRRCNSWRGNRDVALPMRRAPRRVPKVPYSFYWVMFATERYISVADEDARVIGMIAIAQPWRRIRLQELPELALIRLSVAV